jgi:hypothetical protein
MKIIPDRDAFDKLLEENKEAALERFKDRSGNYCGEIGIGTQAYKIFDRLPDNLLAEKSLDFLPEGFAAIIIGKADGEEKVIARSDFRNWYFIGDANFQGARFTDVADFRGSRCTGAADFRGAKFAKYADFEGAKFVKLKDPTRC